MVGEGEVVLSKTSFLAGSEAKMKSRAVLGVDEALARPRSVPGEMTMQHRTAACCLPRLKEGPLDTTRGLRWGRGYLAGMGRR